MGIFSRPIQRAAGTRVLYPPFIRYIPLNAQVRCVYDYHVPWIVTEPILRPDESYPSVHLGSKIELVDAERGIWINGGTATVRRRGELKSVYAVERDYLVFILEAHDQTDTSDIYGSHHKHSRVAIPFHLLRLPPALRLYYTIRSPKLECIIGQRTNTGIIYPPRRSFADVPFFQRTAEQKKTDAKRIKGPMDADD
jgi:hypothetical protein